VASPITGLARTLGALLGGLAVALGGVLEQKEKGEEAPTAEATPEPEATAEEPAAEPQTTETETQED
jgi:large subunit ribosomal protein L10